MNISRVSIFWTRPLQSFLIFGYFIGQRAADPSLRLDDIARNLQDHMGWNEDAYPTKTIKRTYERMNEYFIKDGKDSRTEK